MIRESIVEHADYLALMLSTLGTIECCNGTPLGIRLLSR